MSPRLLCVLVAVVLLAVALVGGRKLLLAYPFMLSLRQKIIKFMVAAVAGFAMFMLVGAFFYLPASSEIVSPEEGRKSAAMAPEEPEAPADDSGLKLFWHTDFTKALAEAKASGKPILVDSWATWCKPCKKLWEKILTNDKLKGALSEYVLVKMDADDEANEEFVEKYEVAEVLPWIGFFSSAGEFKSELALFGEKAAGPFSSVDEFGKSLAGAGAVFGLAGARATGAGEGWLTDLKEGFKQAREENKLLLVDGWAVWCTSCIELKKVTFEDDRVKTILNDYVTVALDMDAPGNQWVWDEYGIRGLPWVVLFEPGQEKEPEWTLSGFEPPDKFAARLTSGGGDDSDVAGWLVKKGFFVTLLLVFLAGIAASLTPCAYPAYLLIFGFFTGAGGQEKRSVWSGVIFAAFIVLGMAISYSAAGIAAALGGGAVGRVMTNPWVMGAIAILFIAIGASSVGVLPPMEFSGLKNAIHTRQKANLFWALIFGLVMGMVVAPCVGPILIGVLTYIATQGNLTLGIVLMSTFAMGMGVLFFGMALFSQAIQTKVKMGKWNEYITIFFGLVFFGAAFYYLKGVIPFERVFELFVL
jgi:thiol:disulfide interchange protein